MAERWTPEDPGIGPGTDLASLTTAVDHHTQTAQEWAMTTHQVISNLDQGWTGQGASAWAEQAITALKPYNDWDDIASAVRTAAAVYEAAVSEVQGEVRVARSLQADAQSAEALAASILDSQTSLEPLTAALDTHQHHAAAIEEAATCSARAQAKLAAATAHRQEADDAFAASLLRALPSAKPAALAAKLIRAAPPSLLIAELTGLTSTQLQKLLAEDSEIGDTLHRADPATVASWWQTIADKTALIECNPRLFGSLDGIPAADRVAANRIFARAILKEDEDLIDAAKGATPYTGAALTADQVNVAKKERDYLKQVISGKVQLYLFDPGRSRIIEMIGTPTPTTEHVITYVPGTFTSLQSFYTHGVQAISNRFVDSQPATVAFVYKDGLFPGENDANGSANLARIQEANDISAGLKAGKTLATFQRGLLQDPALAGARQDAIGHSWGLADITSSEVAGAEYSTVTSLSGAWVPPSWNANPETKYMDYSYNDVLQEAQVMGLVGGGKVPRKVFRHGPYYSSPNDSGWWDLFNAPAVAYGQSKLLANHNLVATTDASNQTLLTHVERDIFG